VLGSTCSSTIVAVPPVGVCVVLMLRVYEGRTLGGSGLGYGVSREPRRDGRLTGAITVSRRSAHPCA